MKDLTRRETIRALGLAGALGGAGLSGCASWKTEPPELGPAYPFYCRGAGEIAEPGPLIRADGTSVCGWMRRPLLDLNLEDARFYPWPAFQDLRLKKWDVYYLFTPDHYLAFLVSWIGFAAFADATVFDRRSGEWLSDMHIKGPGPPIEMARNSTGGVTAYRSEKITSVFEVGGEERRISVDFPGFANRGLSARLVFRHPSEHDSICGVHLANPRRVYYGEKIYQMTVTGEWSLGGDTHVMDPRDCLGALDFGRGYYPPRKFWYWAMASGRDTGGELVGWNLGHGNNPDETAENSVFYKGAIHKMGAVDVDYPRDDPESAWRVRTRDGRAELAFTPEHVKYNNIDLGLLYSVGRMCLGRFNGSFMLDSGERVAVRDVFGIFEWVDQRW